MTESAQPGQETSAASGILAAIRLTSLVSIATIAFGILTNKIVAVVAGPQGVGLLGLYRTISGILAAVLPLGANDIVVRRLSIHRDASETRAVVGASLRLLGLESVAVLLLVVIGAGTLAGWVFPAVEKSSHVGEVRLVMLLTIGVLALQTITACLSGLGRLREVSQVNLATSILTLATVYPFLLLGTVGLAFVIGFTCLLGAGLGAVYLSRQLRSAPAAPAAGSARGIFTVLPLSPWLALQPLLNTGSAFAVQIVLTRHYGLNPLGYYNAASLIETTAIMVLMSSMRSYYLPTLGRLPDFAQKRAFANKVYSVLMLLFVLGITVLMIGAPLIVRVLFSADFGSAADIVRILSAAMVGQVLVWSSAMFLLHTADYRTYLLLDGVWATVRVAGTVLCGVLGAPITAVAWVYAGSYALSAICYTVVIRARHGGLLIDGKHLALTGAAFVALLAANVLWSHDGGGTGRVVGVLALAALIAASVIGHRRRRARA